MFNDRKICYLNGDFQPLAQARIHPRDMGLIRGYGVFDFIQSKQGRPFRPQEHFDRFRQSATLLHLKLDLDYEQFTEIVAELIKLNQGPEFTLRMLLTGGVSPDSVSLGQPTLAILYEDELCYPASYYTEGGKVATMQFRRYLPEAKYLDYMPAIRTRQLHKEKGIMEVIYVDQGQVLEASTSNVMIFKGDRLITPDEGVLKGITRKLVLEAAEEEFQVEKRNLSWDEFRQADEIVLTSTSKDVMPITRVDDWEVGDGAVGPKAKRLLESFRRYIQKQK